MSEPPQILIRDMGFDDVAMVAQLERRSYAFPWSDAIFRDCLRAGYYCCVAQLDHIVLGYAIMSSGAGEAHVLNVCVAEDYRCRGIGSQLLWHLLEFAKGLGVADVFLEVRPSNTTAIRLYQTLGFTQIGVRRGYYQAPEGREDAVVLRRSLGKGRS
ncbi:MAG TPA: ribosomal protein S18-alanine N-acetyltransferase [Steroidobacteraceae bacterium]|nr:ribosomal protein S18-alanine N-acetyltransferase [Steroidobacteraceae bacterium]